MPDPGEHLVEEFLPTIILLLTTLGLLALVLSAFPGRQCHNGHGDPTAETDRDHEEHRRQSGTDHVRLPADGFHIGAGGAGTGYSAQRTWCALIFALHCRQLNFDLMNSVRQALCIALEIVAGILIPLLASLYPVRNGTRVTVREAIQDYGLATGSRPSNPA